VTTPARIILALEERQVLEGLADGSTLAAVALNLNIRESRAEGSLKRAKRTLYGVSENAAALAFGYATKAITRPELLEPEELFLPQGQRSLVPFIGRGMTASQTATELKRPVDGVLRDGRDLLANLRAVNRAHLITRAWAYQILTADQVTGWLHAPVLPGAAEILALVDTALAWDLNGSGLPAVDTALDMAEQLTVYGRIAADDLLTQCLTIAADSDTGVGAQATLGEAGIRLHLKPLAPSAAPRSAAHRVQNLARLVQALNRARRLVREEQALTRPVRAPQQR
jgi:DNA-binding CsgD family transcriptional regulator